VLQAGLLIIAPLVVASALGGSVIKAGRLSTDQLQFVTQSAVRDVSSGIERRGTVYAHTDGTSITGVEMDVTTTAGSYPIDLSPAAITDRTVVSYIDSSQVIRDLPYRVSWINGDGDDLLESGETATLEIDLSALSLATGGFTIEVRPAHGLWTSVHIQPPSGGGQLDPLLQFP
jgi:archaellin